MATGFTLNILTQCRFSYTLFSLILSTNFKLNNILNWAKKLYVIISPVSTHQSVISASGSLPSERKPKSQPASTGTSSLSLVFVRNVKIKNLIVFSHLPVQVMLKMQASHTVQYKALGDKGVEWVGGLQTLTRYLPTVYCSPEPWKTHRKADGSMT